MAHSVPAWSADRPGRLLYPPQPARNRGVPEARRACEGAVLARRDALSARVVLDTTLAITRMIFEGFFDQYPDLKLIASHAGGALPYLAGRFEKGNEIEIPQRRKMKRKPIDYLRHIYYDCITYSPASLEFLVSVVGADRVMFGTDWPHQVYDIRGAFANTARLPKEQCDAIRGNNARRVFGF
ncbi:amidohydrolase family protein [Paraburkholderia sp. MM6662-R1]|uniref:amidohydrolase family protein n=1 Tax=Paraburkholderia sp. MM6662-R1 TaxID=2991066 RepID=UPI003D1F6178